MKETERIADQLKRAFYGEAWSGPSVLEVLEGVTAEMAASPSPISEVHSIWELVHHIGAWVNIVHGRINGEIVDVTPAINFPPVSNRTPEGWKQSLQSLQEAEQALRETILRLPAARLEQAAIPGGEIVYVLLHGAVQHSLYHAGQIALLKKSAGEPFHS